MTYLSYVWKILFNSHSMVGITLGNMMVFFCFFRPRFKWWLYPSMVSVTYLALPLIYKLNIILLGESTGYSILMTYLGYWNIIMVLFAFRERLLNMISLIFTLCILNRMFTFWSYILHIPFNALASGKLNIQFTVTIVIIIMYAMISLVCWLALRDKGRKLIQTELQRQNWIVLGGVAVSAKLIIDFCSDYTFALNPYSDSKIIWAMIALSTFVIAVLVLYLYSTFSTMKHLQLKASTDRLTFEKEAQERYYETQLHNQEELRRMKHDMNGHLNTISSLLSENNKDEALFYLDRLGDYYERHQKAMYSHNPYLNAVVTNYVTVFAENNTPFEQDIQIGNMDIHHVEMCLILNNALQNALDASLKLPPEKRCVRLQVKTRQSRLLFRITNRFNGELIVKGKLLYSTKKDEGHGYGLHSILNAAETLGGFTDYTVEDDIFILDVVM